MAKETVDLNFNDPDEVDKHINQLITQDTFLKATRSKPGTESIQQATLNKMTDLPIFEKTTSKGLLTGKKESLELATDSAGKTVIDFINSQFSNPEKKSTDKEIYLKAFNAIMDMPKLNLSKEFRDQRDAITKNMADNIASTRASEQRAAAARAAAAAAIANQAETRENFSQATESLKNLCHTLAGENPPPALSEAINGLKIESDGSIPNIKKNVIQEISKLGSTADRQEAVSAAFDDFRVKTGNLLASKTLSDRDKEKISENLTATRQTLATSNFAQNNPEISKARVKSEKKHEGAGTGAVLVAPDIGQDGKQLIDENGKKKHKDVSIIKCGTPSTALRELLSKNVSATVASAAKAKNASDLVLPEIQLHAQNGEILTESKYISGFRNADQKKDPAYTDENKPGFAAYVQHVENADLAIAMRFLTGDSDGHADNNAKQLYTKTEATPTEAAKTAIRAASIDGDKAFTFRRDPSGRDEAMRALDDKLMLASSLYHEVDDRKNPMSEKRINELKTNVMSPVHLIRGSHETDPFTMNAQPFLTEKFTDTMIRIADQAVDGLKDDDALTQVIESTVATVKGKYEEAHANSSPEVKAMSDAELRTDLKNFAPHLPGEVTFDNLPGILRSDMQKSAALLKETALLMKIQIATIELNNLSETATLEEKAAAEAKLATAINNSGIKADQKIYWAPDREALNPEFPEKSTADEKLNKAISQVVKKQVTPPMTLSEYLASKSLEKSVDRTIPPLGPEATPAEKFARYNQVTDGITAITKVHAATIELNNLSNTATAEQKAAAEAKLVTAINESGIKDDQKICWPKDTSALTLKTPELTPEDKVLNENIAKAMANQLTPPMTLSEYLASKSVEKSVDRSMTPLDPNATAEQKLARYNQVTDRITAITKIQDATIEFNNLSESATPEEKTAAEAKLITAINNSGIKSDEKICWSKNRGDLSLKTPEETAADKTLNRNIAQAMLNNSTQPMTLSEYLTSKSMEKAVDRTLPPLGADATAEEKLARHNELTTIINANNAHDKPMLQEAKAHAATTMMQTTAKPGRERSVTDLARQVSERKSSFAETSYSTTPEHSTEATRKGPLKRTESKKFGATPSKSSSEPALLKTQFPKERAAARSSIDNIKRTNSGLKPKPPGSDGPSR